MIKKKIHYLSGRDQTKRSYVWRDLQGFDINLINQINFWA